jgi:hypothetical protein
VASDPPNPNDNWVKLTIPTRLKTTDLTDILSMFADIDVASIVEASHEQITVYVRVHFLVVFAKAYVNLLAGSLDD